MDQTRKRRRLRAPTPSMIVACIALFVALGGTSYAAVTLAANSVGTTQIKNGAVTNAKVKDATLTAAKIKNSTLTGTKIAAGTLGPAKFGVIPGARVRRTAAVTVGGSTAVLSYDAIDFNNGSVFNLSNPTRMTANVGGRYLIIASARWESNANGRRTVVLAVNGSTEIAHSNVSAYATASFNPEQTVETVYKLHSGDYVEVWAYQDSGSSLDLMTGVGNAVTFSMEWIAP